MGMSVATLIDSCFRVLSALNVAKISLESGLRWDADVDKLWGVVGECWQSSSRLVESTALQTSGR